jgi:hypothetical protein
MSGDAISIPTSLSHESQLFYALTGLAIAGTLAVASKAIKSSANLAKLVFEALGDIHEEFCKMRFRCAETRKRYRREVESVHKPLVR